MSDIESESLRRALSTIDVLPDATLLRHELLLSRLVQRWNRCRKGARSRPKAASRLEQLEKCLNNLRAKTLEPFLQQSCSQAVGEQVDLSQDTRVNDILLATAPLLEQQGLYKFRKGLAKRSLAMQYDEWQQTFSNEKSRVQDLAEDYSRASERDSGRIQQFLTSRGLPYENRVIDGVKQGTQLLVFERKMQMTGCSALLSFCMGYMSKIKYSDFDSLASIFERNVWMVTTAKTASTWYDHCGILYEGSFPLCSHEPKLIQSSSVQNHYFEAAQHFEGPKQWACWEPRIASVCANLCDRYLTSLGGKSRRNFSYRRPN